MYFTDVELLSVLGMDHFRIRKIHGWLAQLECDNFKRFMDFQTTRKGNIKHYLPHMYHFSLEKVMYGRF